MPDDRLLALARDLESADERLAAGISEVTSLDADVAELGARAGALHAFLETLPEQRDAVASAVDRATADRERRREEFEAAERELAEAEHSRKEERLAAARRAVVRTRDALSSAEGREARAVEGQAALERRAEDAKREASTLDERARGLTERLRRVPRVSPKAGEAPLPGPAAVAEWASRARAALFVVRGALETERERVVREANELAASAFGEPTAATSVRLVRRRLESG